MRAGGNFDEQGEATWPNLVSSKSWWEAVETEVSIDWVPQNMQENSVPDPHGRPTSNQGDSIEGSGEKAIPSECSNMDTMAAVCLGSRAASNHYYLCRFCEDTQPFWNLKSVNEHEQWHFAPNS